MNKFIYRVKDRFRWFIYDIKCRHQRAKKGYSISDLCDIDYWFVDIIYRMLCEFREKHQGYNDQFVEEYFEIHKEELAKVGYTELKKYNCNEYNNEEINKQIDEGAFALYQEKLDEMIYYFQESSVEHCKNKEKELDDDYHEEMRKKAFALFDKYFHTLWM